eukprot:1312912-Prymnesium_polylepis.1
MPLLRKFADAVQLSLEDLLKPRRFEEVDGDASHVWLRAHNLLQRGGGTAAEVDAANRMADAARSIATDMGCKGIIGSTAKKPTTLFKTIETVLLQQCAMRTKADSGGHRVPTLAPRRGGHESREKDSIASWETEELARGCAEKMLIFHREWWEAHA